MVQTTKAERDGWRTQCLADGTAYCISETDLIRLLDDADSAADLESECSDMSGNGTDRLCRALYGREARPRDYLGGSSAWMLHDAATRIERLQAVAVVSKKVLAWWQHMEQGPKAPPTTPEQRREWATIFRDLAESIAALDA
ncbi:MAG: hypothetical protein GTN69_01845 [Armatimonadetes bacterium]|nr:hypothetical protein [Armatimonadota bacterium]